MWHKLSIHSLQSFIQRFKYLKYLMCLEETKCWREKVLAGLTSKLIITGFEWILVLPNNPTSLCSTHFPRWLCHTSLLPLNLQNPLPLLNISWWFCFLFHCETNQKKMTSTGSHFQRHLPVPTYACMLCSPPAMLGELGLPSKAPSSISYSRPWLLSLSSLGLQDQCSPFYYILSISNEHVIIHPILKHTKQWKHDTTSSSSYQSNSLLPFHRKKYSSIGLSKLWYSWEK